MRGQELTYRPDIDGLRAVAVLLVIMFHAFPGRIPGGFVGVDVFFVISGYLISSLIVKELENDQFTFWGFYARRVRRLFPGLTLVLFATMAIGWWVLLPDEYEQLGKHVVGGAVFVSNFLLWSEVGYFDTTAEKKPLLHLWSLGVEEQLYLFWPLVLVLIWRLQRYRLSTVVTIAAASFLLNIFLLEQHPGATFYLPATRLWEFLIGAFLALAESAMVTNPAAGATHGAQVRGISGNALSVAGAILILGTVALLDKESRFPGWVAIAPALGAVFLIAGGANAWLNRYVLSARPAVFIGLISYPLYLWHWPLISYIKIVEIDDAVWGRYLKIGAIVLATVLSIATFAFVERPLRRRIGVGIVALSLLVIMVFAALCGGILTWNRGTAFRTATIVDPFLWPLSLQRSEFCSEKYGQPSRLSATAYCFETPIRNQPTVVIIGDSHANSLAAGVVALESGGVLMMGGTSCPPLSDVDYWKLSGSQRRANCESLMDVAFRTVRRTAPDIVILAGRFAYYTTGAGDSAKTSSLLSYFSPPNSYDAPLEAFESGLYRDLLVLLQDARTVILVLQVPELDFDPHNCVVVRSIDLLRPRNTQCRITRKEVLERQTPYRNAIHRIVRKISSPRLEIVDPMQALCDELWCYATKDGTLLYRNSHHLSTEGAKYVWSHIKPMR
jgi:peptidoglycan/LPS O-acetylase OafA/YrhL